MAEFKGFGPATFDFLTELGENNNRDWFAEHKPRYESLVLNPALDFITAMGPILAHLSPHLEAIPKRQGGSLMRVYRDTRFSKDKTPYKTNIGIQFRHSAGKNVHAPGIYLHIAADNLFAGAGMWRPDGPALRRIRESIVDQTDAWRRASTGKALHAGFELQGERLKRPPRGFDPDHPFVDDLKRKDFMAVTSLERDQLASPDLPAALGKRLKPTLPLLEFLCHAVEVPF